jgi:hypothetical protein
MEKGLIVRVIGHLKANRAVTQATISPPKPSGMLPPHDTGSNFSTLPSSTQALF